MILHCSFCKYFKHTGETELGIPYETGGLCTVEERDQYCNALEDACWKFECGMENAQKIVAEGNSETLAIRDEYRKLNDKYRDLCEQAAMQTSMKVKAEMMDMILKAKTSGMDSYGIMNMLNLAEYALKWVKDDD